MLYAESLVSSADDYSFEIYREGKTYPNKNKFIVKATGAWTEDYITKTNIVPNEVSINTYRRSGKNTELYKNNNKISASDIGTDGPITNNVESYKIRIGDTDPRGVLEADLGEIIVLNKALNEREHTNILSYLSRKWQLTGSVDSDGDNDFDSFDDFPSGLITEFKPFLFNIVFEDEAGNRGIVVDNTTDFSSVGIDTTNPELLDVSIVSNNPDNTRAKSGDNVTLSFKTTEPIQTPTSPDISISGLDTLEFNKIDTEGKQWEVSGTVLASQNGNASFSIEVLDLAGNKGSPVTATDDNTQVVLDTTPPTLSGITLVSTNANDSQAFAKPGDNITLSFNSSEPIQIPSIYLADNDSLTVHDTSSDQDGTSWEVVYTVTGR